MNLTGSCILFQYVARFTLNLELFFTWQDRKKYRKIPVVFIVITDISITALLNAALKLL